MTYQNMPQNQQFAYPLPPQPKKGMPTWGKVLLITGGLGVLLCGGGFVACTALVGKAASDVSEQNAAAQKAVTVTGCEGKKLGSHVMVTPEFTIKNNTNKTRSYLVQIDIYDVSGKTRLAESHGAANNVAAGGTAEGNTMPTSVDATTWKCVVSDVTATSF